ncbi:hypothetical protein [Burkholderia pseudomallei]|uniref:hypothetical protein n=1 Tax=Burkholderia pseudomallei TaxID=28450 RepID=UPI0015C3CA0A|nr:hypothetical protein [Burkholderia pseudomallei]
MDDIDLRVAKLHVLTAQTEVLELQQATRSAAIRERLRKIDAELDRVLRVLNKYEPESTVTTRSDTLPVPCPGASLGPEEQSSSR